ncbi:hypothetical protein [Bacillus safensis]|uniref:hypothetical protein n=1 Tax=Bacillus safensis TaxID=561879 RepID=UPI0039834FED
MNPREAFRTFIKYQLENGEGLSQLKMSSEDVDAFITAVEDDMFFYDKLDEFLKDFIEIYGEDYGIELN